MSLIDAPAYDPSHDNLVRNLIIAAIVLVLGGFILGFTGFAMGHGWWFSNLPAEHKVNSFFTDLQQKNYASAYSVYTNHHPDPDYPLNRFTQDWTTYSPVNAPITSHHVDVSRVDGDGAFGTNIIVGVTVNGSHRLFVNVQRSDGTLTCCSATHIIQY
jgi:hypothetical protein